MIATVVASRKLAHNRALVVSDIFLTGMGFFFLLFLNLIFLILALVIFSINIYRALLEERL